jgi:hypothetical protein
MCRKAEEQNDYMNKNLSSNETIFHFLKFTPNHRALFHSTILQNMKDLHLRCEFTRAVLKISFRTTYKGVLCREVSFGVLERTVKRVFQQDALFS